MQLARKRRNKRSKKKGDESKTSRDAVSDLISYAGSEASGFPTNIENKCKLGASVSMYHPQPPDEYKKIKQGNSPINIT